jgi:putative nucleotidyltransferase with HDIG domain
VWTETNPDEAVRRIVELWPELDIVITDLRMPEMDGVQMMEALRNVSDEIVTIMVTGYASTDSAIAALRAGAYDVIRKPVNIAELEFVLNRAIERRRLRGQLAEYRVHLEDMLRERTQSLDEALTALAGSYMATMEALSTALEKRERQVAAHDKRGAEYAAILARTMGVPDSEIVTINRGAMLHDIGKIGVPDAILGKPGPLTDAEWKIMREHPAIGYQIVHAIPFLKAEADVVYSHHERYDGKGYPRGLKGEKICLGARIFAVADAFEAMRTDRPYRKALSLERAIREITDGSGTQFDPEVVAAFVHCHRDMDVSVRQ